ncbi:MAG: twin-arginine translocase TatA/TatE family subunit [Chthoniobacteraceae bacterium]
MFLLGLFTNLFEGGDLIIILLLALLFFGAKRLPELARGLGGAINEFNKAKTDVQKQISEAVEPPPAAPQVPPPVQPPAGPSEPEKKA